MSENKKDQDRHQPVIPLVEIVAGDRPQYENTGGLRYSAYFIKLTKDPAAIETTLNYYRELERVKNLNYYNSQCFNPFHYEELIFEFEFDCCEDRDQNEELIEIDTVRAGEDPDQCSTHNDEQCDQIVHQWQNGFHSDLFGKLIRETLPPLQTSYVHAKKTGWHTEFGRIVQDPGIPDLNSLSPKGLIHHNRIDDLRQLSYALPKDRRGKILGSQIFHLKEVGKVFSRLPDEEFFNKIQTRIDLIANYFDRQDPKYWQRKDIPAFPCAENLDQLYYFEYRSEKDRIADNVKEFPGGSGEVLQEKYSHPTNSLSNPSQGLVIGCEVLHPAFGKGILKGHDKSEVARDSSGRITDFSKMKLEIEFPSGTKRILAKFCKLILDDGRVVTF